MRLIGYSVFVSIAVLVSSCATTGDTPRLSEALREATGQNGRACVRTSYIEGYGARRNNAINIDARRSYYVATVRPGCQDLATSMAAIFSGDFYEICGGRLDKVAAGGSQCTIDQLFEFEDRAAAFAAYDEAVELRERAASAK